MIASEQFLEHFCGFSCSIGQSESPLDLFSQSDHEIKTRLCEPVDFIEVFDAKDKCDPLSKSGIIDSFGPTVAPSSGPMIPCLYIRPKFQFVKPDLVL